MHEMIWASCGHWSQDKWVTHWWCNSIWPTTERFQNNSSPLYQHTDVSEREFNFTDHQVAEGVHPLTVSAAKKSEDLSTNLIRHHTLAYLTYQFKLNGRRSPHIPEQISEMKVGNLTESKFQRETRRSFVSWSAHPSQFRWSTHPPLAVCRQAAFKGVFYQKSIEVCS